MGFDSKWILFALAAVALSGCTLKDQEGNALGTSDMISGQGLTVPKYADPGKEICKEMPGNKPCYCMACTNKTSYGFLGLGKLFSSFYDSSLVKGNCSIAPCNISDYYGMVDDEKNVQVRTFAIGAGPSFASTDRANLYCNYTLQFATKWMRGGEGAAPRVPQVSRAKCWLERSTLPIYIYYTGGSKIDPARTAQIAQEFNSSDAGPVMITTELGWDGSDSGQAALIRQQVLALDSCDKCLTVLAVQTGDHNALAAIMGVPGNLDQNYYGKIDAVGFGFRVNDYPDCDSDRAIEENIKFSQYILQKYSKPSIWLYVGASEGNGSAGGPETGGCNLTAMDVNDFYSQLLARSGGLASSGILGMSAYEFIDGVGPLPCIGGEGCGFGLLYANGSQKHPQLNGWADMCQQANVNSLARRPLIFSRNGQGSACDLQGATFSNFALMYEAAKIAYSPETHEEEVPEAPRILGLGCGEVCPENSTMKKPITYDNTGNGFDPDHCSRYPIIDEIADGYDISATYLKAEFERESGFDPYAIALECKDEDFQGCNPEKYTAAQICELAGMESDPKCKRNLCTGTNPQNGKKLKPCAYGLAQCIEYPGKAYTSGNPYGQAGPMPDVVKACGKEKYNPFDPGMSACCGAWKYSQFLRDGTGATAEKWVNSNWAELSKCSPDGMMPDEKGWAAYYIASNMYGGLPWNMLSQFITQRDANGACCANSGSGTCYKHYIDYLRSQADQTKPPSTNYGAQVMSIYRSAVSACKSDCPG